MEEIVGTFRNYILVNFLSFKNQKWQGVLKTLIFSYEDLS